MIKDQESLQRMNFLIQAARLYQLSFPAYSSHFIYDFIQLSEKKIIRIDKKLKKKINKKTFSFRKNARHLSQFLDRSSCNQQEQIKMKDEMQESKERKVQQAEYKYPNDRQ